MTRCLWIITLKSIDYPLLEGGAKRVDCLGWCEALAIPGRHVQLRVGYQVADNVLHPKLAGQMKRSFTGLGEKRGRGKERGRGGEGGEEREREERERGRKEGGGGKREGGEREGRGKREGGGGKREGEERERGRKERGGGKRGEERGRGGERGREGEGGGGGRGGEREGRKERGRRGERGREEEGGKREGVVSRTTNSSSPTHYEYSSPTLVFVINSSFITVIYAEYTQIHNYISTTHAIYANMHTH